MVYFPLLKAIYLWSEQSIRSTKDIVDVYKVVWALKYLVRGLPRCIGLGIRRMPYRLNFYSCSCSMYVNLIAARRPSGSPFMRSVKRRFAGPQKMAEFFGLRGTVLLMYLSPISPRVVCLDTRSTYPRNHHGFIHPVLVALHLASGIARCLVGYFKCCSGDSPYCGEKLVTAIL
jgi:hypothetical protein